VTRARLGRYAAWQLRDYAAEKAAPTLIVVLLTAYIEFTPLLVQFGRPGEGALPPIFGHALSRALYSLALLGAAFATRGIVSDDRAMGYFRFLFAKPVSVSAFYAQKFVVYLAGFLLVSLFLLIVHAFVIAPFIPFLVFPVLALIYVGIGGIGFLASALWRLDWVALGAVLLSAALLWDAWGGRGGWRGILTHLLPPVHVIGGIFSAVTQGNAVPLMHLAWIAGYGLVCFLLALLVLYRRPLANA
jgi:hypothetical protein